MDLRFRFTAFFSVFSLICLVGFSALVYTQLESRLMEDAGAQLLSHLEHDAQHLGHDETPVHPNASRQHARSISLRIWKSGVLVEDSFPKDLDLPLETQTQKLDRGLVQRFETAKGYNGFVLLGFYDLTEVRAYLATLRRTLLLACVLALALIIPLSLLSTRFLLKPFRALAQSAVQLNAQRLSFRFSEPRQHDEYGILVRSFNALLTRLEKSFGEVNRFATNASHELRTPLAVIQSQTDFALRRPRDAQEYQDALKKIQEKGRHLNAIIHRLLTMADLERVEPTQIQEIKVAQFVEEVKNAVGVSQPNGKIVDTSGVEPSLVFRGNFELFSSILTNLLENAVKYSKSKVKVYAHAEAAWVMFSVEDDGPGIPETWRQQAFEPFMRNADATIPGMGLGLSIVRACVSACQGTIKLSDSGLGGLRVDVALPAPRGTTP